MNIDIVSLVPWRLYVDGSVFKSNSQCIGIVYLSLYGSVFEASCRLEYLAQIIRPNMKFAIRARTFYCYRCYTY
jgi:hypothetical protein